MLVADYAPAMIDGAGVRPFEGGTPLSRGAEIITLTSAQYENLRLGWADYRVKPLSQLAPR